MSYYFHWDYPTVMDMEHRERQQWCKEISKINQRLNGGEGKNYFDV